MYKSSEKLTWIPADLAGLSKELKALHERHLAQCAEALETQKRFEEAFRASKASKIPAGKKLVFSYKLKVKFDRIQQHLVSVALATGDGSKESKAATVPKVTF
jgi:hypothetical protein